MKLLILFALVAASQAGVLYNPYFYHPYYYHGLGASVQHRAQDNLGNYNFGYNEGHVTGGTFRKEVGSGIGNVKVGSYGLRDADGTVRVVDYVADARGFNAKIHTSGDLPEKTPANVEVAKIKPVEVKPVAYNWGWNAHPYNYGYWW
ncbi:cuticle protein 14-like [Limulus polyphemus]|uniref:Cuticle protein 14-like n=1 Tax=Limulus polyphemus TaxID=6850 RepID=A0ABM1C5P7_LIMPO|nr:cuticle protein 14-like [Limulus polyphemus]